jgi:hypothetical protein
MTTVVIPVYAEVTQLDFTAPHQFLSMVPDITVIVASVGARRYRRRDWRLMASRTSRRSSNAMCFAFRGVLDVSMPWPTNAT